MGTTRPVGSLQQRLLLRLILEGDLSDVMAEGYMDTQTRRLCGAATAHCMVWPVQAWPAPSAHRAQRWSLLWSRCNKDGLGIRVCQHHTIIVQGAAAPAATHRSCPGWLDLSTLAAHRRQGPALSRRPSRCLRHVWRCVALYSSVSTMLRRPCPRLRRTHTVTYS